MIPYSPYAHPERHGLMVMDLAGLPVSAFKPREPFCRAMAGFRAELRVAELKAASALYRER